MSTELSFGVPGSGTPIATCTGGKNFRYSFKLPCHGRWQGDGIYLASTIATVTMHGETKSAEATRLQNVKDDPIA